MKTPKHDADIKVEFTGTERIEKYENIAVEFFDKILGISFYSCFISDLSSLENFILVNEESLKKIELEYGIILKGPDYLFSDIFEQINEKASG